MTVGSSKLRYMGWAPETTYGTGIPPTKFMPIETMDWTPDIKRILNSGARGVAAKDFGAYAGNRSSEFSVGGHLFTDLGPTLLFYLYGADTVTGVGPYTHASSLVNIPSKSLTLYHDYVANRRLIPGCIPEEFEINFGTSETTPITWQSKVKGFLGTTNTQVAASISNALPFVGFGCTLTVGGVAVTRLLSGKLTWRRPVTLLWGANNTQDPNNYVQEPLEVTGSLRFYMADDTELNHVINMDNPALVLTFTQGAATFTWTSTVTDFETGKPDFGQSYVAIEAQIRSHYNSTDSSPSKISVVNTVTAAYL